MVHGKADELKARWAELQRREEECDAAVAAARTAEEEAKEVRNARARACRVVCRLCVVS